MIKTKMTKSRITIVEQKHKIVYVMQESIIELDGTYQNPDSVKIDVGPVYNVYIGSIRGGPILRIEHSTDNGWRNGRPNNKWRIYTQNYGIAADNIDTLEEAENIISELLKQNYE